MGLPEKAGLGHVNMSNTGGSKTPRQPKEIPGGSDVFKTALRELSDENIQNAGRDDIDAFAGASDSQSGQDHVRLNGSRRNSKDLRVHWSAGEEQHLISKSRTHTRRHSCPLITTGPPPKRSILKRGDALEAVVDEHS